MLRHATPCCSAPSLPCCRQFDRDQIKVFSRAAQDGVEAIVVFTSDFEKEELLPRLCKENAGEAGITRR